MSHCISTDQFSQSINNRGRKTQTVVSVIIPALNEEKVIGRCLGALCQMNFSREIFEVIVIDNGSADNTAHVALEFSRLLDLRILEKRDATISALRNHGASVAQGAFLAFLDADCLVPKDWLTFAVHVLSAPGAGIIGAHCCIPPDSSWVARTWNDNEQANLRGHTSYIPSGDMLLSREIFLKMGGFDESLETNEDYEFCQRVREAGYPVVACPQLEVIHLGTPQTLAAFYRQSRWHGRHVFRVFLSSLPSLHNLRAVLFAIYVLIALSTCLAGMCLMIVTGGITGLLASLSLLLAGPLALAVQKAHKRRELRLVLPLLLLFLVYGIARAACLLPWSIWVRSQGHRRHNIHRSKGSKDSVQETCR